MRGALLRPTEDAGVEPYRWPKPGPDRAGPG